MNLKNGQENGEEEESEQNNHQNTNYSEVTKFLLPFFFFPMNIFPLHFSESF